MWHWLGLALVIASRTAAKEELGRATYYGKDEFSLNDGTCACAKQGLWDSNPCSNNFCFDWIGEEHAGCQSVGGGYPRAMHST